MAAASGYAAAFWMAALLAGAGAGVGALATRRPALLAA
jgi:hypothetical protein